MKQNDIEKLQILNALANDENFLDEFQETYEKFLAEAHRGRNPELMRGMRDILHKQTGFAFGLMLKEKYGHNAQSSPMRDAWDESLPN